MRKRGPSPRKRNTEGRGPEGVALAREGVADGAWLRWSRRIADFSHREKTAEGVVWTGRGVRDGVDCVRDGPRRVKGPPKVALEMALTNTCREWIDPRASVRDGRGCVRV